MTWSPRPALHFTAPRGWINDPHGVTFRNGRYHLFHQSVPDATRWEPGISWGHATSPDLLTWEHRPAALVPGEGDAGCWSGSVCVTPPEAPTAMYYTSVSAADPDQGAVRIARPLDEEWTAWRKGPVVVAAPEQPRTVIFRDPNVFWDADCWRMLVGAGYPDGRAAVLCFRSEDSEDQERWRYERPLAESPAPDRMGGAGSLAWECPQLIRVGDRHVLIVSVLADGTTRDAAAAVGNYRAGRLDIDAWFPPTHGPGHYAPTTFLDADGQPCVLFWIRDVADVDGGWSGALSIPYRLSLTANRVALTPHPVLAKARPDPHRTLGFTWRPRDADGARLSLRTDDGSAVLDLVLEQDVLTVATPAAMVTAPLTGTATTPAVQVLVDGCVLEVMTGDAVVGLPVVGLPDLRAAPESITPWWR